MQFKILLHIYRALHGMSPAYISELLHCYTSGHCLRSADSYLLQVPRTKTKWGDWAFSKAGLSLWNDLPLRVRASPSLSIFKNHLKTLLFECAYIHSLAYNLSVNPVKCSEQWLLMWGYRKIVLLLFLSPQLSELIFMMLLDNHSAASFAASWILLPWQSSVQTSQMLQLSMYFRVLQAGVKVIYVEQKGYRTT